MHLALHTSAFEAVEETLVNARSSGEHEPEELRMKREMLEAMTLPVVRVFTAYELVPNELDTVKQVAEKLRGKVIFTLHRIATYATAKLLHPDRCDHAMAVDAMQALTSAHEALNKRFERAAKGQRASA